MSRRRSGVRDPGSGVRGEGSAVRDPRFYRRVTILLPVACIVLVVFTGCVFVNEDWTPASQKNFSSRKELKQASEIRANLEFPIGHLEVDALPSGDTSAYLVNVDYNENKYQPDLEVNGESAIDLRFKLQHLTKSIGAHEKNRGEFRFNRRVPIELKVKTGVGENQIDLTSLKIRELILILGVGAAKLTVMAPNTEICQNVELKSGVGEFNALGLGNLNFRDLKFEGGVGETNLDLTGEWTHNASLDIKVGIGAVNIMLPTTVGAEVHATKTFMSGLSLRDFQKESSDTYRSNNFDKASHRLTIDVKSGIGSIEFRWK